MLKSLILFLTIVSIVSSCSQKKIDDFILVKGGAFLNTTSNYYNKNITVSNFYMSKYEVSQKEWRNVMGNNPSSIKGDSLPVESVSWYDCIEFCNKKSSNEKLTPYYNIDKSNKDAGNNNDMDSLKWTITVNIDANGYRLPTLAEWEYAAGGGRETKHYTYSGSNKIDEVAWYWRNAGDNILAGDWTWVAITNNHCKIKPFGTKLPNELGFFDMSGNVREWCWNWIKPDAASGGRAWKGGGWIGAEFCCESAFDGYHDPNGSGADQGFRLCRNSK